MSDQEIVREAQERFKYVQSFENTARERARYDTKFYWGDKYNNWQWPDEQRTLRINASKPCITVNKTQVHCNLIINDFNQNKPSIKIRPVGGGASFKASTGLEGIIRHIEYVSNAQDAYSSAAFHQVVSGYGTWRIITKYINADSFDQDIFIERIPNPESVYIDPNIRQYDGSDAKWGFVFVDVPRDQWIAKYPQYKDLVSQTPLGQDHPYYDWYTDKHIRVSEYYRIISVPDTLYYVPDGILTDGTNTVYDSQIQDDEQRSRKDYLDYIKSVSQRSRKTERQQLQWFKLAGDKIVDRIEKLDGKYIPLVRVIGYESYVEGMYDRRGHVRGLLGSQNQMNVAVSAGMEAIGLQTKIPWLVTSLAIEGYEDQWERANTTNFAYLQWNDWDDEGGKEVPKPERMEPAEYPDAYLKAAQQAEADMSMATGQYEASFGQQGNERSGKAIDARQAQGATATYQYTNNMAKSIRYTGRIILDLIPHVYDTKRTLKVLAQDGTMQSILIDPKAPQAHMMVSDQNQSHAPIPGSGLDDDAFTPEEIAFIINPSVGEYDVQSDVGPAYGTQRQEGFNAMNQLMQEAPDLIPNYIDIWAKMGDFPGADQIVTRARNLISPAALGKGPSPAEQQLHLQLQQSQGEVLKLSAQNQELKSKSLVSEQQKDVDIYKAETDRIATVGKIDPELGKTVVRGMSSNGLGGDVHPLIHAQAIGAAVTQQAVSKINPEPEGNTQ